MKQEHGLIIETAAIDHYVLGATGDVPKIVLRADRNYLPFLPQGEVQSHEKFESYNCTGYGWVHTIAIMMNCLFGQDKDGNYDWSERFQGVLAETTERGNSPHKAAEAIREYGLLDAMYLPFSEAIDTWEAYYSPKPMTENYLELAREFKKQYDFKHDWSVKYGDENRGEKLYDALQYGPQGMAVYAWEKDPKTGYYFRPEGEGSTHWCVLVFAEPGQYGIVFDTYPDNDPHPLVKDHPQAKWLKVISWHHLATTEMAKRCYIAKKKEIEPETKKPSFVEWLKNLITLIKKWHA